jgi:hypothetical protein
VVDLQEVEHFRDVVQEEISKARMQYLLSGEGLDDIARDIFGGNPPADVPAYIAGCLNSMRAYSIPVERRIPLTVLVSKTNRDGHAVEIVSVSRHIALNKCVAPLPEEVRRIQSLFFKAGEHVEKMKEDVVVYKLIHRVKG